MLLAALMLRAAGSGHVEELIADLDPRPMLSAVSPPRFAHARLTSRWHDHRPIR
jgi:hypothetical protein